LSLAGHTAVVLLVISLQPRPPPRPELPPIQVQLVELRPEPPAPPAPAPAPNPAPPEPAPPKVEKKKPTPPKRAIARPTPAPPQAVKPLVVETARETNPAAEVSDAEVASAATAGSGGAGGGGGGGDCNMVGWLQGKLRKDRRVQAALAEAHNGRAIRVWNGDWITHPGQEGKGLAAVRESIMWEVAFAPEACRKQRVRGLILLSLNDGPGSARVVMGAGDWRWSDLLFSAGRGPRGG
jgi:hypothetical protein